MRDQSSYNFATSRSSSPIVVVSHPRSGNTLMLDFVRRHFPQSARRKMPLQNPQSLILDIGAIWKNKMTEKKARQRLTESNIPLIKMHGFDLPRLQEVCPEFMKDLFAHGKIFYVVRDVRSMLCSYHEYAKLFWEPARVPISEFIRQEEAEAGIPNTSRVKYWSNEVVYWGQLPGVTLMQFERFFEDPIRQLETIAQVLKQPAKIKHPLIPPKTDNRWQGYVNRYLTILPSSTSAPMKKPTPNWFESFDESDLQFIREEGGEALDLLGYSI
ncbi:MAG: sulfotransferase domain-containing protein [Bacteroidota bacterium]